MATLIQSKQIEGVVTASVVQGDFKVSGSLVVTGSGIFTNDLTAAGTISASRVLGVQYDDISGTPNFVAGTGIAITQVGDNITITNTGGGGGVSGSAELLNSVALLNAYTASNDIIISGINQTTASLQSQINALVSATSSYITTDNTGSDSQTLSIVGDQLSISSGNTITIPTGSGGGTSDFTQLTNVPSGLVSGSSQLTSSFDARYASTTRVDDVEQILIGRIDNIETFTQSIDLRVTALENATDLTGSDSQTLSIVGDQLTISGGNTITIPSGSGSGTSDFTQLTNIPSGLVSGSSQVDITQTSGYNTFSSSIATTIDNIQHTQIPSGVISGSTFTDFSSSVDSRLTTLEGATDNTGSDSQTLSLVGDQLTISGGNTVTLPSGSGGGTSDFTQLTNVPSGLVSSSAQTIANLGGSGILSGSHTDITSLNQFTQSAEQRLTDLETFSSSLDATFATDSELSSLSSSIATTIDGIVHTQIPSGTISGSDQVTQSLDSRYLQSSTYTTDSASFDTRISSLVSSGTPAGTVSSSLQTISHLGGTNIFSGSVIGQGTITITSGSGNIIISGSGVGGSSDTTFDGNRVISNEDLGDLFTNQVNPGTSGSIQDFLNAVFYPNTGPSISTGNQTISEYVANGTTIVTLSGTDPEGQTITWGTGSSYTDDLVRVASNGVMALNALAESSSFNTDSVGGGHGHLVTVKATDTFNTSTEKDIYIIVTPNEAPKFRQTSVGGSVITSFTANLNENSTNGTVVGTIYFTDTESDSITIYSSSIDNNHFVINKYPTYVQIVQNTGSLDYEQQTSYSFSISASDEHYEAGQDLDSITSLPITINVTDNQIPVVNNQTLSSISENSSNGATVDSIAASDNEGDSITFLNFNLHKLLLDGVEVPSGSYGGTSQLTDPTENPFQMNSSGVVTRKSGVFLNSDLINSYQYRVQVKDDFNTSSPASIITIPITDDTPATLSDNFGFTYIIESATSGTAIRTNSNGFSGTQADLNSNQSGTWSSSNSAISINSNGNLSLGVDLSGSVTQSGDIITSTITFTNTFGTTTTQNVTALVTENQAPTATFTNQSSNFNTNLATDGTTMVSMSITDTEGDTPYSASLGGTNTGDLQLVYTNSNSSSVGIQANGNLSAGTYNYDVVVTDSYSKSTTYSGRSFTIAEATTGSLSVSAAYVIESATNGDQIKRSSDGRTGNQSYVSVAYSPNYGSQTATSFASSNNLISINSSTGYLSVGNDISGSGNIAGDTITTTITWTDQYGNNGSSDIDIAVTKNNAPTVSGTSTSNLNTNQATGSSQVLQLQLTDTEGDSIPNTSLSFTDYNSTYFTPSISSPYMRLNVNNTSVPAGTYPYTASIQDIHGFETRVHSGSFTIVQSGIGTLGGDTSIYIIESAENGAVFRDATGYNQGNAAQLSVSYSPNYGSQIVQSYTSSNAAIVVDGSGNLTLGVDISGSVTQSGDTITSTITFRDQYDNIGSGSVTATVFGNSAPSANFTSASSYDTDGAISGSTAGTLIVTDTENNSPYVITLGGTDGGKFDVQGSSSPFTIQPTGSLSDGSYSINITVTDNYGESVTLTNESIVVDAAVQQATVYVYTLPIDGTYNNVSGITAAGSGTPPTPTISTSYGFFTSFVDSDTLGDASITVAYGTNYTANLRGSASGADVDTILDGLGALTIGGSPASERVYIMIPSGSGLTGVPTSMTISDPGSSSTVGEYILFVSPDGTYQDSSGGLSNDIKTANIHKLTLDTPVDGYSDWIVIGTEDRFQNANAYVRLIPSSGSTPT